jgi:hypothetical protein
MKVSKSAIFLFELIFVIFVFTVSAAICANIFGQSYSYSRDSKDLTEAMLIAETQAEEFKADASNIGADTYTLFYDKDWNKLKDGDKKIAHTMDVDIKVSDGIATCAMSFDDDFYELTAKKALAG